MNRNSRLRWSLVMFMSLALVGCNQPSGGKKTPDAPAQTGAQPNTTDSK